MIGNGSISTQQAIRCISRGVFIELLRKKDIYVLGLLILVFCVGAFSAKQVGVENPATGTFLLNLGMTLAYIFTHLLTLFLASRQIPAEIENRTIYPLLARPIARVHLLLGKWLACTLCGYGAYLIFTLLVWTATPKLELYDSTLFGQLIVLQFFSIGLTSALAILLSLIVPKALAVLIMLLGIFAGQLTQNILFSLSINTSIDAPLHWFLLYLPDLSKFQIITRYTDGMEGLTVAVFLGLILHGLVYMIGSLYLGHRLFKRRPL